MFYFLGIIILIFIDLLTKYFAKIYLVNKFQIFWDFVYLKYIENTWIAFWMPLEWVFLKIITLLIVIWIVYYFLKFEENKNNIIIKSSYALILAWALGNWYERIFNWVVIDFVWVRNFSVFNLADTYLSIWAFLYILFYFLNKKDAISR